MFPAAFLAAHAYDCCDAGGALPPAPPAAADPVADVAGRVLWRAAHFGATPSPPDARTGQPTFFGDAAALPQLPVAELLAGADPAAAAPPSSSSRAPYGVLRAMGHLRDYGFVVVTGVPPSLEATQAACAALAPLMPSLYSRSGMWVTELRPPPAPAPAAAAEESAAAAAAAADSAAHTSSTDADSPGAPTSPAAADSETSFNDTAFSTLPLPEHLDGAYLEAPPGLQAFHALRPDPAGGHSLLVDGFAVAARLRAEHPATFAFFAAHELRFHHTERHTHVHQWRRVFELDDAGEVARVTWNNDDRAPLVPRRYAGLWATAAGLRAGGGGDGGGGGGGSAPPSAVAGGALIVRDFYAHLPVLLRALRDPLYQLWLPLRPGSLLLFDNTRVLHGRSAIDPRSARVLAGCYIAQQDWQGRWRALAAQHTGYAPAL